MSKNFDICHTLRHLRMDSKLKIKEVVERLRSIGIKNVGEKTLYNYEIGYTTPNADVFLELCVIYGCDNPLAWWDKNTLSLSADEKDLVKKYRMLDEYGIRAVNSVVTNEHDRCIAMDREKERTILGA